MGTATCSDISNRATTTINCALSKVSGTVTALFSGDTRQIRSVETSDALRILETESGLKSISLTGVQRQTNPDYREAIKTMRGSPEEGFGKLEELGVIREVHIFDRGQVVADLHRAYGAADCGLLVPFLGCRQLILNPTIPRARLRTPPGIAYNAPMPISSWLLCAVLFFNLRAFAQQTPLTQRQACAQFSGAVVRIDAGGEKSGTGFLVSADGFVLTAFHIVADETTNNYFPSIVVGLPDGTNELAKPVAGSSAQEYAILKVPRRNKFPYLELGSIEDVGAGSSAALIGYPFGAALHQDKSISTKFCLSTTIAAKDALALKTESVKTDVIYFQGPSVQGTSGGPLISLENGRVIGIEIAGLRKKQTASSVPADHPSSVTINTILSVLVGERLEIGLGAATGIDDPARALKQAQRVFCCD